MQPSASHKHLGIRLSTDAASAATDTYSAILGAVRRVLPTTLSAGSSLNWQGRACAQKQVLASKVTYHATFVPIPQAAQMRTELASCSFYVCQRRQALP